MGILRKRIDVSGHQCSGHDHSHDHGQGKRGNSFLHCFCCCFSFLTAIAPTQIHRQNYYTIKSCTNPFFVLSLRYKEIMSKLISSVIIFDFFTLLLLPFLPPYYFYNFKINCPLLNSSGHGHSHDHGECKH